MLGTDVALAESAPFLLKNQPQCPVCAGRVRQRVGRLLCRAGVRSCSRDRRPVRPRLAWCHIEGEESFFNRSAAVLDEREHKMLNADGLVLKS